MSESKDKGSSGAGSRWFRELDEPRKWEDFYRRRWQYDKTVRTSHSVNCSGSCSWEVFVKNGMITWELQKTDWPQINDHTPSYEPRGCQRGISASWYPYSPVRPKYPYVRGVLLKYWREELESGKNPVEAWASIVEDEERKRTYRNARGKAGWRRVNWDEATELIAAAKIYTIQNYGPDHLASFSPIPAMSMVSFLSGHRLSNLLGGAMLSFYEWYHDLPHIMPMIFGDQTDVHESADWYQGTYWIVMGSNLPMTRTADAHFASEHKYNGGKLVNLSPDYSDVTKFADLWVPVRPGTDAAFLMACIHVILQEFHYDKRSPYFHDYVGQYTNLPFLVCLEQDGDSDHFKSGRFLRASEIAEYQNEDLADWKMPLLDKQGKMHLPGGSVGTRWEETEGRWNMKNEDIVTGEAYDPMLTMIDGEYEEVQVQFADFTHTFNVEFGTTETRGKKATGTHRGVPSRVLTRADGSKVRVATAYDLMLSHYGVRRGLSGTGYPKDYDDATHPYTPAWQEQETGVDRNLAIRVAREWADTAEKTKGKCLFITGSGILHWYHGGSLTYRTEAIMGIMTGCMGVNGGGFAHYVGTEKIRNVAAIGTIGFGLDWGNVPRHMNATSYWYFHTDQWRYDGMSLDPLWAPHAKRMPAAANHAADMNAVAVRNGWLPFFPQFDQRNPLDVIKDARNDGCSSLEDVQKWVCQRFKDRELKFSLPNVDAEKNHPKVLWIYRGNLIGTSMRGHEINLKHMLGTHHNVLGGEGRSKDMVKEVEWNGDAPLGKWDLIYNVNLRMDSSANYSDIVLPTAHWYEKFDLTCSDLHSFLHPFTPAHDPAWECKHDWEAFRIVAEKFSELAKVHLPDPVEDVVMTALATDSPDEMAQPMGELNDWWIGEGEPVAGKSFPNVKVIERDYTKIHEKYTSLGPTVEKLYGAKGIKCPLPEQYEQMKESYLVGEAPNGRPSMDRAEKVCEVILRISPESDGEVSYQLFKTLEKRCGVPLAHIVEHEREIAYHYPDLISQPRRSLTSPHWSAIETGGRTYGPWTLNIETLKPFHTLTGRMEVYYDHVMFRDLGEDLPTYKPPVDMVAIGDVAPDDMKMDGAKLFRFITPHQKWGIHSMFGDSWQMQNMFRGGPTVWINDDDAKEIKVKDNDWVEIFNENGIQVARAVVSHTVPRDMSIVYHQTERHVNVPFSSMARERGCSDLRGGNNNATTRIMMNPATMVGGYANWTYWINYQGTSPSERDCVVLIRKKPMESRGRKVIYQESQLNVGA